MRSVTRREWENEHTDTMEPIEEEHFPTTRALDDDQYEQAANESAVPVVRRWVDGVSPSRNAPPRPTTPAPQTPWVNGVSPGTNAPPRPTTPAPQLPQIAPQNTPQNIGPTVQPTNAPPTTGLTNAPVPQAVDPAVLQTFMKQTFKTDLFTPSTGIGRFGLKYTPKTGVLDVIVRLHFQFDDVNASWKDKAKKGTGKWSRSAKTKWVKEFKQQIEDVWGNITAVRCTKPGFESVVVAPRIKVEETTKKANSHYNVVVDKAFENVDNGKVRTATGSTSVGSQDDPKRAAFQEQDNKDKINDPRVKDHFKATESTVNIKPAMDRDRERLIKRLTAIGDIGFTPSTADLSPSGAATNAATMIKELRKDSALFDKHGIVVQVASVAGESPGLAQQRFDKIKRALEQAGVTNTLTMTTAPGANPTVTLLPASEAGVLQAYEAGWKRLTIAHEFGHMLGLLDEYCQAVSPHMLNKMVAEGAIGANPTLSTESQGRVAQDSTKQDAYADLLDQHDLDTPTWARPESTKQEKSTSLMSGGFEVLDQHFVTIYEGLGDLCKAYVGPGEWHIDR